MVGQPPLTGLKVLEFAGLAPGPFAGLLLADAGASVLRIDRALTHGQNRGATGSPDLLTRYKSSLAVDLKSPSGIALIHALIPTVDILIDPFRPCVLEKLNLGPSVLLSINPRLIYARMTGFRRSGSKYATMAGHDINYLSVSGVLSLLGRKDEKPTPPINILGDFAGGGAMLVQGILMALISRQTTGKGQVVEANMVDGASYLATYPRFALKTPVGDQPRGENLLDSGCPYYDTYETSDKRYVAVGALEPQFFADLMRGLGLAGQGWEETKRYDRRKWPELRRLFEETFKTKTRAEWEKVFDGTDACCTPVLEYPEMERDKSKTEGDQRPAVTLRETPLFGVSKSTGEDVSHGQGSGVDGEGYEGVPLGFGEGGQEKLKEWLGWTEGVDYTTQERGGAVILPKEKSKL
ncbi:CoA-transferase family III domain-containing protein [Apodospora peruviana]|uniref:CoA-transferase family III domain-containing protein n=1 Tax=Apodospora peruviana TaxID=516989 RepID=A0AAE0IJH0_9PEZI|nr:CoA-transferase family III domain-containing protein [Apodospora peruviana]